MTPLNPVFTVGEQVGEVLRVHHWLAEAEIRDRVIEMFRKVGIPAPEKRFGDYPHSARNRKRILLKGDVPSSIDPPSGCRFHTRCPYAVSRCSQDEPPLAPIAPGHLAACFFASENPFSTSSDSL